MNFYLIIGLVGTILFFIKLVSTLAGAHIEMSDLDDVGHHDMGGDSTDHFQLFSYQSILAFCMLFGWSGLAYSREFGFNPITSLGLATVTGVFGALINAVLMGLIRKLNHSPLYITPRVGTIARVYFRIPEKGQGRGKIVLENNGRLEEFDAVSDNEAIESQALVQIVATLNENDFVVKRLTN
jgi:hypothetical protein